MPWQLSGNGRSGWSTKLIRGLKAEAAAGFQSTTHCLEGRINLGTSVRIVNLDLQSHRTSGSIYFLPLSISGTCIRWINDYAYPRSVGQQITEHLQPLCSQLRIKLSIPVRLPPGRREARSGGMGFRGQFAQQQSEAAHVRFGS
jgi:hypothetical protein